MALFGKRKQKEIGRADSPASMVTLEDGRSFEVSKTVDCIGDSCPRPQLMTRKALGEAAPGEIVVAFIDNPTSLEAIPPMLPELQAEHLGTIRDARHWRVVIRRIAT